MGRLKNLKRKSAPLAGFEAQINALETLKRRFGDRIKSLERIVDNRLQTTAGTRLARMVAAEKGKPLVLLTEDYDAHAGKYPGADEGAFFIRGWTRHLVEDTRSFQQEEHEWEFGDWWVTDSSGSVLLLPTIHPPVKSQYDFLADEIRDRDVEFDGDKEGIRGHVKVEIAVWILRESKDVNTIDESFWYLYLRLCGISPRARVPA